MACSGASYWVTYSLAENAPVMLVVVAMAVVVAVVVETWFAERMSNRRPFVLGQAALPFVGPTKRATTEERADKSPTTNTPA